MSTHLSVGDWLMFPEQKLLEVTAGAVYHDRLSQDGLSQLAAPREQLAYYPHDIWLYRLAAQSRLSSRVPDRVDRASAGAKRSTQPAQSAQGSEQTYQRYPFDAISWVNTALDLPDLIAETTPGVHLRKSGRGWTGWCPWHDDTATQVEGTPGMPSLYVVKDFQYGWSWRCYSTNCGAHQELMHDTFDWLVWLAAGNRARAIAWADERYH